MRLLLISFHKSLKSFELTRGKKQDRAFYKAILNKHEGIINRYGEVDATLLSDDEIAKIKNSKKLIIILEVML